MLNLVNIVSADFLGLGFTEYASVMVPVDIAATLVMLHLFFRKDIPPSYDLALLKAPVIAIKDLATFVCAVCNAGRAGATPLFHFVMRY